MDIFMINFRIFITRLFTRKMEQFLQERPELNNHVTGLKEDIADLIKVLSEKLTVDGDAEAAIDEEVSQNFHF